jgi:hypothetical protein
MGEEAMSEVYQLSYDWQSSAYKVVARVVTRETKAFYFFGSSRVAKTATYPTPAAAIAARRIYHQARHDSYQRSAASEAATIAKLDDLAATLAVPAYV